MLNVVPFVNTETGINYYVVMNDKPSCMLHYGIFKTEAEAQAMIKQQNTGNKDG